MKYVQSLKAMGCGGGGGNIFVGKFFDILFRGPSPHSSKHEELLAATVIRQLPPPFHNLMRDSLIVYVLKLAIFVSNRRDYVFNRLCLKVGLRCFFLRGLNNNRTRPYRSEKVSTSKKKRR